MAIIVSNNKGSGFSPIEEGTYFAVCYGLIDVGDVYSENFDKCTPKFSILWELIGTEPLHIDGKDVNRTVSKSYTKSLNPKSNLRKDLRAWRGREFTDEELKRFDMVNILGAPCQIQIVNAASNGKTYSNIAAIMNLPKGTPKPTPTLERINWDFEDNEIGDEAWSKIPPWLQGIIKGNETYKFIVENDTGHLSEARKKEITGYKSYQKWRETNQDFPVAEGDEDELPF